MTVVTAVVAILDAAIIIAMAVLCGLGLLSCNPGRDPLGATVLGLGFLSSVALLAWLASIVLLG